MVIVFSPLIARQFLPALLFFAALFAILGLVFFIRYPGIGFPLLIPTSLLVPFALSTGTQTRINSLMLLTILLFAAWLADMLIIKRQFALLPSASVYAALAFSLATLISFGFGQLPWYPTKAASLFAQIGQVLIMLMSAAAFILAAHKLEKPLWLKMMVYAFIIIGGIYSVGFFVPPLRHYVNRIFQRAVLDSLFWTWLIVLSFSQAWSNKSLSVFWRVIFFGIALSGLYNVLITKQAWVSGWLPAAAALFVVLLLTKPRLAVLGVFAFILLLIIRFQILQSYLLVGDNEYSILSRVEAWKIMFQIIQKNPLFGVGPANYYFYTPFYNILGYSVSFNFHNNYIDLLAQTGIAGTITFLWWAFEIAKSGLSLLKTKLDAFEHSFTIAALGGLAGTLVAAFLGDWAIPFIYNIGMEGFRSSGLGWVFLGSMVFLQFYKKREVREE